jgi:hypothetical protein
VRAFLFSKLLNNLVLLRLFAIVSMTYSFWIIFRMDEYLPWQVRFFRALELTFIGHVGLWLAAFQWKGKFRFVIAAIFFTDNSLPNYPLVEFGNLCTGMARLENGYAYPRRFLCRFNCFQNGNS